MPIHDFECECGHTEERIVPRETVVKHCGKAMKRLISSPGRIIFKGLGFYATEYGKQGYGLSTEERNTRSNRELKNRGYL